MTIPPATGLLPPFSTVGISGALGRRSWTNGARKPAPARRWVVERTLGWLSKCRAILVRYDKRPANYLGLLQLACALIWYRRQRRLVVLR